MNKTVQHSRSAPIGSLETIIETSADIISLKDTEFRYLIANRAHERLFGIRVPDIIGKTDFDFMPEDVARSCRESDELALGSDEAIIREEQVMGRWFEVRKHAVRDAEGHATGIVAIIHDISERR